MNLILKEVKKMVLAICLIAAGCTQKDSVEDSELEVETKSVRVTILQEGPTRSGIPPQTQVESNAAISISNGYLYFTDRNGTVLLYRKIDKNASASAGNTISLNQLQTTGAIIEGTPGGAVQCYVFLNLPDSPEFNDSQMAKTSGNISSIESLSLRTSSLYDAANGGVGKIPMRGKGTIVAARASSHAAEVSVNMEAIASRIEIAKISTVASSALLSADNLPYEISSFTVAGIFINNFFGVSRIDGLVYSNALVFNNVDKAFVGTEDSSDSPYIDYTELYTYSNSVSGIARNSANAPNVIMPPQLTGRDVWAYNVFPNDTLNVNTSMYVPHIIVRFSRLAYHPRGKEAEEVTLNDRFITVKGFMLNGSEVQYLMKGRIYRLSDISFSLDAVAEQPEANTMNVKATMSVIPWMIEEINPVL